MTEQDKDESLHGNTDKTDEEVQDTGLAFDDDLDSEVNNFTIDHVLWLWCIQSFCIILSVLQARCLDV
jgi:hypothetical protein